MIITYVFLLIVMVISLIMLAINLKSKGVSADALWALSGIGSSIILIVSIVGLLLSSKTEKVYRSEYDKIIQSIDSDKTKVIKEDDEITDIYITVNGEEYHFDFKED